jgi:hypothetical protein
VGKFIVNDESATHQIPTSAAFMTQSHNTDTSSPMNINVKCALTELTMVQNIVIKKTMGITLVLLSISVLLYFVQSAGLLSAGAKGLHKR